MWRTVCGGLLAGCLLLAAFAAASGQEGGATEKRAAIKKLLEVDGAARQSSLIFSMMLDRVQGPMADSMIAGLRADGFFRPLSKEEGAELERRIKVFMGEVFGESKRRVAREVATPENLERVAAPAFDKYLTLEDINALIAFEQTPLGKKLNELGPEMWAEGVVASLEAKGVFKASPEEMTARLEQAQKELQADPSGNLRQILSSSSIIKRLTADEVRELAAFRETPFGRKFVEVYPRLQAEMATSFSNLYGQQVGTMLSETYSRKLNEYAVWLSEATRPGARRGAAKPVPQNKSLDIIIGPPDKKPGRP
ncbi:MAG: DUF2059 domain-containing protein [Acidobacteriota bacterium]|nr:DUF2059 domain-containing protein [Acidobacteriota bacterium]